MVSLLLTPIYSLLFTHSYLPTPIYHSYCNAVLYYTVLYLRLHWCNVLSYIVL